MTRSASTPGLDSFPPTSPRSSTHRERRVPIEQPQASRLPQTRLHPPAAGRCWLGLETAKGPRLNQASVTSESNLPRQEGLLRRRMGSPQLSVTMLGTNHLDSPLSAHSLSLDLYWQGRATEALELLPDWAQRGPGARNEIRYNPACYGCFAGNMGEAQSPLAEQLWLHPGKRMMALADPDLHVIRLLIE
jgi:hypothetical protein